jgi:hypothetical protein
MLAPAARPERTNPLRIVPVAFLVALASAFGTTAEAARGQGDWPCIQREVPQISAGMVWTVGPIDAEDQSWSKDQLVADKVAEVSSRRKTVDQTIKVIDEFAGGLKEDRARVLTALFTGVLQRLNAERRQIMGGIKRYARKQAALAKLIKDRSIEWETLSGKTTTEEEKRKLAELEEQLAWDTRIYDEREQSLRYVCEIPVFLEQRLFKIGRHISQLISQK